MSVFVSPDRIRRLAMNLDCAVEKQDAGQVLEAFAEDCAVEIAGIRIQGKEGVERWLDWMNFFLEEVRVEPLFIKVDRNRYFSEFNFSARLKKGPAFRLRQSEVLHFDGEKVRDLWLQFDPRDLHNTLVREVFGKWLAAFLLDRAVRYTLRSL